MKLAQYKTKRRAEQKLCLCACEKLIDVAAFAHAVKQSGSQTSDRMLEVTTTQDVIRRGDEALNEIGMLLKVANQEAILKDELVAFTLDSVEFLPVVYPEKILAIGRNYVDHAIEGGAEPPKAPLVFTKLPNSLSAHGAPIVLPTISTQVDYEAELAVVIGRRCKRVAEAEALRYVFGYTPINDVSAR